MSKVVSLSVHRNNREQREKHRVSNMLRKDIRTATRFKDLDGYAFVVWTKSGDKTLWALTGYQGGSLQPRNIPDFVRSHLQQDIFDRTLFQALGPPPPDEGA